MSKSAVRIGLISTGVIGFFLFILYLPVLIWSPPWGDDGYFYGTNFNYERPLYYRLQGRELSIGYMDPSGEDTFYIDSWQYRSKSNDWYSALFGWPMIASLNSDKLQLRDDWGDNGSEYTRSTNPFTVWYIKWLEWTH